MNTDIALLQNISNTLKIEPYASQRVLAENAKISSGLMNACLKRFVERGWIMLTNVNARKIVYAVTPQGMEEIVNRGKSFMKRTFKIAEEYSGSINKKIAQAKNEGKTRVVLYGQSYVKFLIVYACETIGIDFEERSCDKDTTIEENTLSIVGEMEDEETQSRFEQVGCVSLFELCGE